MRNKFITLMYHSISNRSNGEIGSELYCVSKDNFKAQMEYLTGRNANITFDDGDISSYQYAYPILKKFGLKVYFFIILSKVGTKGYMNWEQIKELRDAGMIIGSHSMTHRILTELKDSDLDFELGTSKKFLEDNLGQPVDYFSIPRGFHNKNIIDLARQIGYKRVFTSNIKDTDGFKFGRIPVKRSWDLRHFIKVINNGATLKDRTETFIKNSAKDILGVKHYDRVRSWILK